MTTIARERGVAGIQERSADCNGETAGAIESNHRISPGEHEPAEDQRSVPSSLVALPPVACGFAVCIGILVLIGWSFDLEPLKRVLPGFVAMNPATAALFILTGIALASALRDRRPVTGVMGKVLSALVVVAAASELLEFAGICRSPLDEVLFAAKVSEIQDGLPNRMAPNTALNFFLAGLSILLLDTRGRRSFGQALAVLIGIGAILSITGDRYGVQSFSWMAALIPTALHTAVTFLVLAAGIFFAVPRAPLAKPFATNDPRERLARILRILFPLAVLFTLFLGWLCVWGERHELYESAFGTALYAIILSFLFAVLVRWAISAVGKVEAEHAVANARLREVNRRKDEMIAVVSHDLCSPLTGFRMVIDVLRSKSEEPTEELLGIMDHSARRMVSMVRGLLDISKLQADQIELELENVLVSDVIRQSMEPLAINANAKRITLQIQVAPGGADAARRSPPAFANFQQPPDQRGEIHTERRRGPCHGRTRRRGRPGERQRHGTWNTKR